VTAPSPIVKEVLLPALARGVALGVIYVVAWHAMFLLFFYSGIDGVRAEGRETVSFSFLYASEVRRMFPLDVNMHEPSVLLQVGAIAITVGCFVLWRRHERRSA
jgi:hypothetical protein